jgi:hypothetical protein
VAKGVQPSHWGDPILYRYQFERGVKVKDALRSIATHMEENFTGREFYEMHLVPVRGGAVTAVVSLKGR